uniref:B-block_TFIIIC domain-containing protein n=1 Tax=Glossina brevipalpis TaxID=37001 RepID=A0A1A9WA75_9MUSC
MYPNNRGSVQRIILDEIALEGLEGITLPSLWVYMGKALEIALPLPSHIQDQIWQFILRIHQHLQFFQLPHERETIEYFNRYQTVDADLGAPVTPAKCPFIRYKCVPISEDCVMGSCEFYKERKLIPFQLLKDLDVATVMKTYGKTFVIVASQELRYNALTPENISRPKDLTPIQYCIWEAIGRSRFNGETTAGPWSLQHFCKDATIVFYIKNKLIRHGVISHHLFNEKRGERLIVGILLTLPRFHPTNRSTLIAMVEKLYSILKEKPDQKVPLVEILTHFPTFERSKTLRKAMLTHLFRQIFETQSLPYLEVYKNAKSKNTNTNSNSKGRTVTVVSLRYPDRSIDELFHGFENEHGKNDSDTVDEDFHNEKHSFVDMTLREEFYQCVSRFGSRGCSQTEIYRYMSTHHLTLRQLVKQMLAEGLIKSYFTDAGRQRLNMYVAIEHADPVKKKVATSLAVLRNLQCAEEPNLPEEGVTFNDIPQITARIKPYEYTGFQMQRENNSQKVITRKTYIVKTIDEKCIMSIMELCKAIKIMEANQGQQGEVCRKSIRRLLCNMSQQKIIRLYEIALQCEEQIRLYRLVTHPKIDIDHKVLKNEILKLKNSFFLSIEERRLRQLASFRYQSKRLKSVKKIKETKTKEMIPLKSYKHPKFLISRYLHEFLFYIVVELSEYQATYEVNEELLMYWQQSEPALQVNDYLKNFEQEHTKLRAYTRDISWRTFIQPLPNYSNKPVGWVYFVDAIDRMPLSIFNKIFRIDRGADQQLADYLAHPIRQHYLMRQLPADLQCKISRVQLQRVYISILKLLNHMGLVQVGDRLDVKDPLMMWVYFNRKARIFDTTPSEKGYSKINAEREYIPIYFEYRNFDDVHHYWTTLQRICVYTKLGFRRSKTETSSHEKVLTFLTAVDFDEAPANDNGNLPGDGLGAACLSTRLFAHTFRNWSWSIQSRSQPIKNLRTGRTLGSASTPKRTNSKTIRVLGHSVRKTHPHGGVAKRAPISPSVKRAKKNASLDAIDRDALKNMRTLRVQWSKKEDELLLVAKAVSVYLAAPIPAFGLLSIGKVCRDVIRHSLGFYNKTTQACVRRVQFLVRQKRHIPQVPTLLHMMQTNNHLQEKYSEGFLQKLKKIYPDRNEYTNALALHFTWVMCFLYKKIYNTTDSIMQSKYMLPDTVSEFEKCFMERRPVETDEDVVVYRNPETDFDLKTATVINTLHSSLCSVRDKTLYNLQAFEIYKSFSEEILQTAFAKARSDGLVVAIKRKNLNLLPNQLAGPAYVLSSKYRLRLCFLRIPYNVYESFYTYYENILSFFFGRHTSQQTTKNCMELKSPTLGQLFVIAEALSRELLVPNIKLPINMLTVDAEQNQTVSAMDRILDHYHSIFDNAPKPEYSKYIENEPNEKQVRVKFHPANLSYKLHYTPYDFISKLPMRYLHFFCALKHMDQEIDINFNKLQKEDEDGHKVIECPFKCILSEDNYLSAIEGIVGEKKDVLNSLSEIAPQKLLNMATSGLSVKVENSNLLTLIRMLESFWHEKETETERKDLGKLVGNLKTSKPIDWCQLCRDILTFDANHDDYDKPEEYEPTLNKEERIVRAQDVFVVNLPTLQLKLKEDLLKNTDTMQYNALNIPKVLMESEFTKEQILKKVLDETLWKYTDFNIDMAREKSKQFGFNEMEQERLIEIHNFIENHNLGVTVTELMRKFPYIEFLQKSLDLLSSDYLIKRVGIYSFMYVHKTRMRSWVVHTFNLKRLERENIGGSTTALKRNYESLSNKTEDNSEEDAENPACKLQKVDEITNESEQPSTSRLSKRIVKPVKRYLATDTRCNVNSAERDIIVIKPAPWIRLNGSLNRRVLDKWLGSILTECVVRCCCSIREICLRFPHMVPVDIMFLLEILNDLKCLHMIQIEKQQVDIFTEYETTKETTVTRLYDPEKTYIHTHGDAIMRLTLFIGKKKYSTEFI